VHPAKRDIDGRWRAANHARQKKQPCEALLKDATLVTATLSVANHVDSFAQVDNLATIV